VRASVIDPYLAAVANILPDLFQAKISTPSPGSLSGPNALGLAPEPLVDPSAPIAFPDDPKPLTDPGSPISIPPSEELRHPNLPLLHR
jgi:hypothetical protein